MASPNLSEIVTTTLRNRTGKLADNVTKNNALLNRLRERGNVRPVSGGRTIVQELEYAENGTFMWYAGYQTLDITPSDVFSAAEYDWKQAAVAVSISGLEERMNSGPEEVIDLLASRIKNAEKTMMNNVAVGVYSNGSGSGGLQIGGLQLLVADTPTSGIVGGINRAQWSFWQNQYVTDGSASLKGSMLSYMNDLYVKQVRGTDKPDLGVADNEMWKAYLGSLQAIQRITDEKTAQAGFQNIQYMGFPIVLDGGYGGACPTNHMYFLNTDYLFFRPHRSMNFAPLGDTRTSINQDATVRFIGFMGNMTLSNAFLQGVLYAS